MDIQYINEISEEDYNRLRKAVGWFEIPSKKAEIGLKNTAFQIVATDNHIPVGMARLISDGGYVRYIADVVVLPGYQGCGIGKTMINKIMDYIDNGLEDGDKALICLMAAKDKEPFYKLFGLDERPNDSQGAGMSKWITK
jgi:GNAT superfamily N-acetyltransferase